MEKALLKRKMHCPRCRRPVTWEDNPWRPFCSEKCRLVDLGRWADEDYRIPAEKAGGEKEDADNIIDFPNHK